MSDVAGSAPHPAATAALAQHLSALAQQSLAQSQQLSALAPQSLAQSQQASALAQRLLAQSQQLSALAPELSAQSGLPQHLHLQPSTAALPMPRPQQGLPPFSPAPSTPGQVGMPHPLKSDAMDQLARCRQLLINRDGRHLIEQRRR